MDFGKTLQPLALSDDAQDLYGCPIRPKSYALIEGEWKAYEYELGPPDLNQASISTFFETIQRRIEELRLANVGLRRYMPSDPEELEVTETGGISIKIPCDLVCTSKILYIKPN